MYERISCEGKQNVKPTKFTWCNDDDDDLDNDYKKKLLIIIIWLNEKKNFERRTNPPIRMRKIYWNDDNDN